MHETLTAYTHDGQVTVHAVLAELTRSGLVCERPRAVQRTVLDTFDGRLHEKGLRLELRRTSTPEIVLRGQGVVPARVAITDAPRFARDLPPGPLRSRLAAVTEVRALLPVVSLCERETTGIVRDRKGVAVASVVVHEDVTVAGVDAPLPWTVDIVELPGYAKAGEELRDAVERLGSRRLDGDLIDLAFSASGVDPAGFTGSPTIPLDPRMPALDAFRAVLANLDLAVEANWQGTIDDLDSEFLHELRVAVRRTRSILAAAKDVLPADVRDRARDDFAWLGQLTGRPRDLDVNIIEWDEYVAGLDAQTVAALGPVRVHLLREQAAAHAELATELAGPRATEVRRWWREWLADPRSGGGGALPAEDGPEPLRAGRVVAKRIRKAQQNLLADGRAITPETPAVQLHELRKDAKRLRYLLECFGGMAAEKATKPFVRNLKVLQENLGQFQDNEVHAAELRTMATEVSVEGAGPQTLVAIGELAGAVDRRRADARIAFAEIFTDYESKATRQLLDDIVGGLDGVKVVAVYSIKGGVGKTTASVNLAHEAAATGARVLLWDLDPQGAATYFFRLRPKVKGGVGRLLGDRHGLDADVRGTEDPSLHAIPSDFSLRHLDVELNDVGRPLERIAALLDGVRADYDVVVLDCAPGITLASEGIIRAADVLLVPTIPAPLSVRTLDQLRSFLADRAGGPDLLPFLSMVDARRRLQRDLVQSLRDTVPGLLQTAIPSSSVVERMASERAPVSAFAPRTVAALAFRQLWTEVADRLWS